MLNFLDDVFISGTKLDTSVPIPLPPPWNSPSWEVMHNLR